MRDTRKIAKEIVDIVNDCTNDYDAVDLVQKHLDSIKEKHDVSTETH